MARNHALLQMHRPMATHCAPTRHLNGMNHGHQTEHSQKQIAEFADLFQSRARARIQGIPTNVNLLSTAIPNITSTANPNITSSLVTEPETDETTGNKAKGRASASASASCHQCKTKKDVTILFFCTKTRPCSSNPFKTKRCRKKYCRACMVKYYVDADIDRLEAVKDAATWRWECPSCIAICTCKACERKSQKSESAAAPTPAPSAAAATDPQSTSQAPSTDLRTIHAMTQTPTTTNSNAQTITVDESTLCLLGQLLQDNPELRALIQCQPF